MEEIHGFSRRMERLLEAEGDPDDCSNEASNDLEEEVESKKDKKDLLIQKVLDDYYHQTREKTS